LGGKNSQKGRHVCKKGFYKAALSSGGEDLGGKEKKGEGDSKNHHASGKYLLFGEEGSGPEDWGEGLPVEKTRCQDRSGKSPLNRREGVIHTGTTNGVKGN